MIKQFTRKMAKKAIKNGIDENFGRQELCQLKDKVGYNPYGNEKERNVAKDIDYLDSWLMCFDDKLLSTYKRMFDNLTQKVNTGAI